jgi:predicted phage terminase large subunit-like protein
MRELAARRIAQNRAVAGVPDVPLLEWIPRYATGYGPPRHLAPLCELLERAEREPVQAVVHAPPRHGKSETILAALARYMQRRPDKRHAYITYQAGLANEKSRRVQDLAMAAGVELRSRAIAHWWTRAGGALFTAGVLGPFTGRGVNGLMVIDDPFKSRLEAESSTVRNRVSQWFKDVAYTRREPGCSIIIVMTRWHPQDLAGEKIASGWESVCLPAIDGDDQALWPSHYPIEELRKIEAEVGAYTWASLYQGQPRGRGGSVFEDVHFYDELPNKMFRTGLGFDLAYTAKKYSDYSAAVALRGVDDTYFVAEAVRKQARASEFKRHALDFVARHGRSARRRWYCSGTEIGVADLLKSSDGNPGERSLDVGAEVTRLDKFTRAQPMAAAWTAGRVLVPSQTLVDSDPPKYAWVEPFVTEMMGFTGLDDEHDDQTDAAVAAYDVIKRGSALGRFKAMAKM